MSSQQGFDEVNMYSIPLSDEENGASLKQHAQISERNDPGHSAVSKSFEDCTRVDMDEDEAEEKARMVNQVLELQNTLDDLSQRVDAVKDENLKLKSENQILGQYIENLMSASSVFQSTSANHKRTNPSKPARKDRK